MEPAKEYHINNSTIRIFFGDILDSQAEVIVSSADSDISMSGGISKTINDKEGTGAIGIDVRKSVPAEIGNVIVSTAGTLPQRNIFHVITIDYNSYGQSKFSDDLPKDEIHKRIIGHSIDKCFLLLHALDLKSIAFPSIGAGVAGFPFNTVAETMAEAIAHNLEKTNKSFFVELYLHDRFNKMVQWDFLPMFEQFCAQEAIAMLHNEQAEKRLNIEYTNDQDQPNLTPEIENDVFISYSREDSELVKSIYEWLKKSEYTFWMDVDGMYSGESFKKVIINAIKHSKVLLFMSSEKSNESHNVISEVSHACKFGKKIIPVRLDMSPYDPEISYDILNYHYVDYDKSRIEISNKEILKTIVTTLAMIDRNR